MKIAHYGTAIVVMHVLLHGLHGLAHNEIPIPLSLLQGLFVGGVVILAPIIAAGLLWTPFYRIGSWLLLGSMTGSLLSAIYNHHLVISPDHVSQVSFEGWGLLFQVTAYLMLIVDGLGCWISVLALRTTQPPEKAI
ncbi:hypothetical protein SAMD00079811_70560 [Scytonema sp. HK-05]|uniref:hypothetical protein n=1 Tax=Scytonema sp. HK-05 TaxID=1137095 RepID=UPI000937AB02|nr:hypothetical protein [Scytonema sp. HK-05]OKH42989.1 hypothetical protein NIES2130_39195 [Scytonema sp. HK-05]BAY49427.1 hypothetical protein SAMD00079811_70560 [Scytonema sp. HK-05]